MSFYHDGRNVENYIDMAKGYDGTELIKRMTKYLKKGASILELGMGPGKDMDILLENYDVTGTDESEIFVDMYKFKHPEAKVSVLDAVKMDREGTYDCIYSNKVLMHLTSEDMIKSLKLQKQKLNENGIMFHSLWMGTGDETYDELLFVYYTEEEIRKLLGYDFEILEIGIYMEVEENDSLYIVLR